MSFQWIVDNAQTISINRKKMVAQTTARDGQVRAVSRGTMPFQFSIQLPSGLPWDQYYEDIEDAEALDRISTATITIPFAKFPWFYGNTDPGSDDSYTVRCIQFPEWTIFDRNLVNFNGPFVFVEDV